MDNGDKWLFTDSVVYDYSILVKDTFMDTEEEKVETELEETSEETTEE